MGRGRGRAFFGVGMAASRSMKWSQQSHRGVRSLLAHTRAGASGGSVPAAVPLALKSRLSRMEIHKQERTKRQGTLSPLRFLLPCRPWPLRLQNIQDSRNKHGVSHMRSTRCDVNRLFGPPAAGPLTVRPPTPQHAGPLHAVRCRVSRPEKRVTSPDMLTPHVPSTCA